MQLVLGGHVFLLAAGLFHSYLTRVGGAHHDPQTASSDGRTTIEPPRMAPILRAVVRLSRCSRCSWARTGVIFPKVCRRSSRCSRILSIRSDEVRAAHESSPSAPAPF